METKQGKAGRGIRKDSGTYRFYMLDPREGSDISSIAGRLMAFKEVEEVYVTEGDHGFIVKARLGAKGLSKGIHSYISKAVDRRFGQATSCLLYKK